jgi:hypothetical protein
VHRNEDVHPSGEKNIVKTLSKEKQNDENVPINNEEIESELELSALPRPSSSKI